MAEYARTVAPEVEIAIINAAVELTKATVSKTPDNVERQYRQYYNAIVESFQEVYPQMTSAAKRA
jgi:hypothetical protein